MSNVLTKLKSFNLPMQIVTVDGFDDGVQVRLVSRQELNTVIFELMPIVEQFDRLQSLDGMGVDEISGLFMDMLKLIPEKAVFVAAVFMGDIDVNDDNSEEMQIMNLLPIPTVMQIAAGGFRFNIESLKSAFDAGKLAWQGLLSQAPAAQETQA